MREINRQALQRRLEAQRSMNERNPLGQFATPYPLACEIMACAFQYLPSHSKPIMLEPSCGTGVFFSALEKMAGSASLGGSVGYEIDADYAETARSLWEEAGVVVHQEDFLLAEPDRLFPLIVANPPYTRHHYLSPKYKQRIRQEIIHSEGISLSSLSGLYCYFMLASCKWLQPGGISCWLIPSEFLSVNYGTAVKSFLATKVDLLRIHRFSPENPVFDDALVSSSVVFFRRGTPSRKSVMLSSGDSLLNPEKTVLADRQKLMPSHKWHLLFEKKNNRKEKGEIRLGEVFDINRGLATGNNAFFIVDRSVIDQYGIPESYLVPVLPAPRHMKQDRFNLPATKDRKYLLCVSCDDIGEDSAYGLRRYIEIGEKKGANKGYICSHRKPWYVCGKTKAAPIVATYMSRRGKDGKTIRFIMNDALAVATNNYLLLSPKEPYRRLLDQHTMEDIWRYLNEKSTDGLESFGRTYGGGLVKFEPSELKEIPIPSHLIF